MRARPGGWGGGTPWTHASGVAVSLANVFSARVSADSGKPAPGSRECPRPARPASPVARTNARDSRPAAPRCVRETSRLALVVARGFSEAADFLGEERCEVDWGQILEVWADCLEADR